MTRVGPQSIGLDGLSMAPQLVTGIVREVEGGTVMIGGGRYTIETNLPNRGGLIVIPGQRAGFQVYPTDIEADPAVLIGSVVGGIFQGDLIIWLFPDPPKVEYCGGSLQSMPMMIDPLTGLPIPVPPLQGGTASGVGQGSGEPTGPPVEGGGN